MKKCSLLLVIILIAIEGFAQENNEIEILKRTNFGLGLGIGGFYPENVNDYVSDYFDAKNYEFNFGFPQFAMFFSANFNVQYFITSNIELNADLTGSWAPKLISEEPKYYHFSALSPGIVANYHFENKRDKTKSYFVGGGVNYNFLSFKFDDLKVEEDTPGFIVQIGLMTNKQESTPIKHSLTYRNILADDISHKSQSLSELSYKGLHYTFGFYF